MGGKSQPDFGDVAAAQGEENRAVVRDQLYANRPTQYSPWGSTEWDSYGYVDPATGENTTRWTQTTGLSPELEQIFNKQLAIQGGRTDLAGMLTGRMGSEFGTQMNWDALNPLHETPQMQQTLGEGPLENPYATRQRAEDSVYNQAMSRVNPAFDSKRNALEIKLRNMGIGPEDEAWKAQMQTLGQQENDARNQALWSASGAGRQESGQMYDQLMGQNQNAFNQALSANQQNFGQEMQSANYAAQIRQQQLTEAMQQRGFSLNEINALLSGQQVNTPQMPSFIGAQAAQPAPIYQAGVDQSNFEQGQQQMMMDAVSGIAGGAMMMSDRRLKKNIVRIGTVNGFPWYRFDYIWGQTAQGVMADEVPVDYTVDVGGFKAVDYSKVLA